jgi:transposase
METQKKVKQTPENYIKELRRKTRRAFSTEQKISIVVEGMRAETSVREICRKYGIVESLFISGTRSSLKRVNKGCQG